MAEPVEGFWANGSGRTPQECRLRLTGADVREVLLRMRRTLVLAMKHSRLQLHSKVHQLFNKSSGGGVQHLRKGFLICSCGMRGEGGSQRAEAVSLTLQGLHEGS